MSLSRRFVAEFVGTALLLAAVVGSGIMGARRPADVPAFVAAQFLGAAAATTLFRWLIPAVRATAPDVVVPRERAS
jgi:glycerol uptake facilitator-like aquaporin